MIHTHADGRCTISSHRCWLPGVYDDARTARYAFRLTNVVLERLQQEANQRNGGTDGVVTYGDLVRAKCERSP